MRSLGLSNLLVGSDLRVGLAGGGFGEGAEPGDAGFGGGTGAFVVAFEVTGCLFVFGVAPVVPSGGRDVIAHLAIYEGCIGVGTPWTA